MATYTLLWLQSPREWGSGMNDTCKVEGLGDGQRGREAEDAMPPYSGSSGSVHNSAVLVQDGAQAENVSAPEPILSGFCFHFHR